MRKFFKYNPETYQSEVTLIQNGIKVVGRSKAHADDYQYANQYTGLQIAEFRALIKLLTKRANRKKKIAQLMRNDAQFLEKSADEDAQDIHFLNIALNEYLAEKDALYKNLKNPPPRIGWEKLDESMLNEGFKKQLKSGDVIDVETKS